MVLYRDYIDSFNTFLESHFLLQEYEVPLTLSISDLILQTVEHMESSPLEYKFTTRFPHGIVRHEALPLKLLALTNRGRIRPSDGQIHLQRMAVAGNTSIGDLFGNTNYYSNPRLCLENNRFVLNFGACIPYYHNIPMLTKKILVIAHYPVTVTLPIPDGLGTRRHNCLSKRIYRQFPYDGYIEQEDHSIDTYESSGGESDGSELSTELEEEDLGNGVPNPPNPVRHWLS